MLKKKKRVEEVGLVEEMFVFVVVFGYGVLKKKNLKMVEVGSNDLYLMLIYELFLLMDDLFLVLVNDFLCLGVLKKWKMKVVKFLRFNLVLRGNVVWF